MRCFIKFSSRGRRRRPGVNDLDRVASSSRATFEGGRHGRAVLTDADVAADDRLAQQAHLRHHILRRVGRSGIRRRHWYHLGYTVTMFSPVYVIIIKHPYHILTNIKLPKAIFITLKPPSIRYKITFNMYPSNSGYGIDD